jgi:hypothetical protein
VCGRGKLLLDLTRSDRPNLQRTNADAELTRLRLVRRHFHRRYAWSMAQAGTASAIGDLEGRGGTFILLSYVRHASRSRFPSRQHNETCALWLHSTPARCAPDIADSTIATSHKTKGSGVSSRFERNARPRHMRSKDGHGEKQGLPPGRSPTLASWRKLVQRGRASREYSVYERMNRFQVFNKLEMEEVDLGLQLG